MNDHIVDRLARVVLNATDAERLSAFYVDALGFERVDTSDGVHALALGATRLDLRQVAAASTSPGAVPGWSPLFQHCAILVSDIHAAMRSLQATSGWTPISTDGPQRLPPNTGNVTAFKFRDPEGHPLELLALPGDAVAVDASHPFERIDHSAISVADVARSIAFYADLGLRVSGRSLNVGPEQQRLDAITDVEVDVVGLAVPAGTKPHLELLGYRGTYDRSGLSADPDDVVATRLVFTVADSPTLARIVERHANRRVGPSSPSRACLRDPDGHLVELEIAE
jgi:catechol 2,3-dioxygenase-like lactoylglutathione lyase family enzyme